MSVDHAKNRKLCETRSHFTAVINEKEPSYPNKQLGHPNGLATPMPIWCYPLIY